MSEEQTNGYRTSDLYYAAYLRVAGVKMSGTHRDGGRVYFLFDEEGVDMRELRDQYYNRTSKVAALSYADEIKVCKHLTHEARSE